MGLILSFCFGRSGRELPYKAEDPEAPPQTKAYSWDKKEKVDSANFIFDGVTDAVVGKRPGDIGGQQFIIQNCKRSRILILDTTASVNIDDCSECDIIVGPCKGSVFVRDCQDCRLLLIVQQFRTRDCGNLDVWLYCQTQPIIEESRAVRFAAASLSYDELPAQMTAASLSPFNNRWSDVHDFTPGKGHFSLMDADQANPFEQWSSEVGSSPSSNGEASTEATAEASSSPSEAPAAFQPPPLGFSASTSEVPVSLGKRGAGKGSVVSHVALLCRSGEASGLAELRTRAKAFLAALWEGAGVALLESKEIVMGPADAERIFATERLGEAVGLGPVVVLSLAGPEAQVAAIEETKAQGWEATTHFLDPDQFRLFSTYAEMQHTV